MTNGTFNTDPHLAALERVLDVFGSDPARWPVKERSQLMALITEHETARRLHSEAKALDAALVAERPLDGTRSAALSKRIMEAAQREQAGPARLPSGLGTQLARERFTVVEGGKPATSPLPKPAPHWFGWATAAALAASLALWPAASSADCSD